jgi:hypothetical protein
VPLLGQSLPVLVALILRSVSCDNVPTLVQVVVGISTKIIVVVLSGRGSAVILGSRVRIVLAVRGRHAHVVVMVPGQVAAVFIALLVCFSARKANVGSWGAITLIIWVEASLEELIPRALCPEILAGILDHDLVSVHDASISRMVVCWQLIRLFLFLLVLVLVLVVVVVVLVVCWQLIRFFLLVVLVMVGVLRLTATKIVCMLAGVMRVISSIAISPVC